MEEFKICDIDGTEYTAKMLLEKDIDNKKYAIYSIDNIDGSVDVYASYIVNNNGKKTLDDIHNVIFRNCFR